MVLPFIVGAFALLGVGGSALLLGELNSLVTTIFANSTTIMFAGVIGTGLFIAYQTSTEKNPDIWDNVGVFAGVVGLLLAWLFLVPTVSTQLYGWNADVQVDVKNPSFDDPYIQNVEAVSVEKGGKLSLIDVPGTTDDVNGEVIVSCGQGTSKQSYGMEVFETQSSNTVVSVSGIEGNQGDTCTVTTTLNDKDGNQIDSYQSSFTLGEK